ncbi:phage baseplate protein, partial [Lactococcus garvieae]|nr:phage baseplate protein [Lactococcus garvieae]
VTMNNGWYEEKLGDNYYRWTQIFTVGANIAAATGSLYNSDTLTIPAAPTGAVNTNRTVTISAAPWPCWAGYFATAGGFRLFSTVVRSYGQVTLEAVLYGSKS